MSAFLQTTGLSAGYGATHVLHDLSIEVALGQIVAVIGPNGAGKSTLARALTGFARVFEGDVAVDGASVLGWSSEQRARRGIVQVPEGRRLFPRFSVQDNLELAFFGRGGTLSPARRRRLLDEVCSLFPILAERSEQLAGTLSGGQQQMLAIGRALLLQPKVLILDEPATGLAPIITRRIFAALQEMVRSTGCACLLIEQRAAAALVVSSYCYGLERGRLSFAGPSAQIMADERARRGYLGG